MLSIFLVFCSCQKEELQQTTQGKNSPEVVVTSVKISTVRENNLISDLLDKFLIEPIPVESKRAIKNPDFQIVGDETRFVKIQDYQSYTFPITFKNQGKAIYNLVLSSKNGGEFQPFIVQYNLKFPELLSINQGGKVSLKNKVKYYPVHNMNMGNFFDTYLNARSVTCYARAAPQVQRIILKILITILVILKAREIQMALMIGMNQILWEVEEMEAVPQGIIMKR
ncbi:hypothetical protein [Antarcticibacterium sp. W02-3]|uniref:hypothetical protein n=1 Tax=Antarcticibacterium sp. W02-3 TaxID=2183747 RepID=UPI0020434FF6|nr:hypothetical protein [Antarcticibacterium sp. W02-3]